MSDWLSLILSLEKVIDDLDGAIKIEHELFGIGGCLAELEVCRDVLTEVLNRMRQREKERSEHRG